jgi:hypothetical protein
VQAARQQQNATQMPTGIDLATLQRLAHYRLIGAAAANNTLPRSSSAQTGLLSAMPTIIHVSHCTLVRIHTQHIQSQNPSTTPHPTSTTPASTSGQSMVR